MFIIKYKYKDCYCASINVIIKDKKTKPKGIYCEVNNLVINENKILLLIISIYYFYRNIDNVFA